MSDRSPNTLSWLIPSLLSVLVGLAAVWQGYQVAAVSQETQKSLEISKVKLEIISSAKQYDRKSSEILFEHVLKPIDSEESYKKFRDDFLSLNSEIAPTSPESAKKTQIVTQEISKIQSSKVENSDFSYLVEKFPTGERLTASDELVVLYKEYPEEVVFSLINGLLPENDKWSYRVNLYIAFTLARMQPSWTGSQDQLEKIQKLKGSINYDKDDTFKRRVDEALKNYKT